MLAKVRQLNGCQEVKSESIHKIHSEHSSIRFKTCIGNFVKPQVRTYLDAHFRFEQGIMPYAGGLMDQPAKVIDIFDAIGSVKAEIAANERKKSAMMSKRGGRG
jgi:hypothetical protein